MAEKCVICSGKVEKFEEWRNKPYYSGICVWSPGVYSPTRYAGDDREYGNVCGKCVEANDFGACPACRKYNHGSTFYPHICFRCEEEAGRFGLSHSEYEEKYREVVASIEILRLKAGLEDQNVMIHTLNERISELEGRSE